MAAPTASGSAAAPSQLTGALTPDSSAYVHEEHSAFAIASSAQPSASQFGFFAPILAPLARSAQRWSDARSALALPSPGTAEALQREVKSASRGVVEPQLRLCRSHRSCGRSCCGCDDPGRIG
jgi:hypothetical protein